MGSLGSEHGPSNSISSKIKALVHEVHHLQCPHVPTPPTCKKRAAVALIIRVRPTYPHQAVFSQHHAGSPVDSFQRRLDDFFAQSWVEHGDPEILFIKRAARTGDRWTGHIALPGGKRDPEDADDQATSIRETMEEIGLDLDASHCLFVGNLPERIVTTAWGKVPLMVLCPFVYLILRHDIPPLTLQPTEVHSAHWVPVRVLISSSLSTIERCDVSERLARPGAGAMRFFLRVMFGQMMFAATHLVPTESLFCSSVPDFLPENRRVVPHGFSLILHPRSWLDEKLAPDLTQQRPMVLWGLTLGMISDFLESLPSDGLSKFWMWPTFTPWDLQFAVWLFSYSFRTRKLRDLLVDPKRPSSGGTVNAVESRGLDIETFSASDVVLSRKVSRSSTVHNMLDGYFDVMKKAVVATLLFRLGVGTFVIVLMKRKLSGRR